MPGVVEEHHSRQRWVLHMPISKPVTIPNQHRQTSVAADNIVQFFLDGALCLGEASGSHNQNHNGNSSLEDPMSGLVEASTNTRTVSEPAPKSDPAR